MYMRRVSTGIPGLDELLYGGFLEGDAVMVAGSPGAGKSTLGMQYLYEGIMRYDEPGLFITFEEFPQQIYRDALNFGWDFRRLEEEDKLKVLGTSHDLLYQDIKRHEGIFPRMIREIGARRVVVDSITHFQRMASNQGELREIIYSLINALKREGLTPLLLRELVEGEVLGSVHEEYTVDTVLYLTMERIAGQRMRFIEVLKSRGSRHVPAKSLFFLGDGGIEVVPPFREASFRYKEAMSVGIPDLDELMGGGIPLGSFYLFEIAPELHQEIFELNFMREAIHVQDYFLELTTSNVWQEKLESQATYYGVSEDLARGVADGNVTIVNMLEQEASMRVNAPMPTVGEGGEAFQRQATGREHQIAKAISRLDEAFQLTTKTKRGRLFLDFTRMMTMLDEGVMQSLLTPALELIQRYNGVCLGLLQSNAVPPSIRARLLMEADGIVRIWRDEHYTYVQVVKTVNSVQTPVSAFIETNEAPYLRIYQS